MKKNASVMALRIIITLIISSLLISFVFAADCKLTGDLPPCDNKISKAEFDKSISLWKKGEINIKKAAEVLKNYFTKKTPIKKPQIPIILSPKNNQKTSQNPEFKWQKSNDAEEYDIMICKASDCENTRIIEYRIKSLSFTKKNSLPPGEYKWSLRARNKEEISSWTGWENFEVIKKTGLGAPVETYPVNNRKIKDLTPTFKWNKVSGAEEYSISICKEKTCEGNGRIELKSGIKTNSYTLTKKLAPGKYKWVVRAKNKKETGEWSFPWKTFEVLNPSKLDVPVERYPINNKKIDDLTPRFIWNKVSNAEEYSISICKEETCEGNGRIELKSGIKTNSFTLTKKLAPGKYKWVVRAENSKGTGEWSFPWKTFEVVKPDLELHLYGSPYTDYKKEYLNKISFTNRRVPCGSNDRNTVAKCIDYLKQVKEAGNFEKINIVLSRNINADRMDEFALGLSNRNKQEGFIRIITLDDFYLRWKEQLIINSNNKIDYDLGNKRLSKIITNTRRNNVKFGVTIYDDDMDHEISNYEKINKNLLNKIDYVIFYSRRRAEWNKYEKRLKLAKKFFPNAEFIAGTYFGDRRAIMAPVYGQEKMLTSSQLRSHYEKSLRLFLRLYNKGEIRGIEFFNAMAMGMVENFYKYHLSDKPFEKKWCVKSQKKQCIANTKWIYSKTVSLLNPYKPKD